MNSSKRICTFISATCLVASVASPQVMGQPADGLVVNVGQTVEITRSHSRCWYPTVHQFRTGEILVGMNMSPDEVNSESSFSAYCISNDGGLTWSRRYTLGSGANQDGAWSETPDDSDAIWQMGSYPEPCRETDPTAFYVALTKFGQGGRFVSIDRGVVFRLQHRASFWPTFIYDYWFDGKNPISDTRLKSQFFGRPWGGIIQDKHGELLCCAYYVTEPDAARAAEEAKHRQKPRRYFHDILLRSTDHGRNWSEYSTIAAVPIGDRPEWMGSEGPCEASVLPLQDGRLYAVYRTGNWEGMLGNGWSSDGGKTWTAPASIGFQGVAPRIHRLHNGMLMLVTGRPGPVTIRFNVDGTGQKWSHALALSSEKSTSYADVAEIRPGKLLIVFDSIPYGWHEIPYSDRDARNKIYGTFVDVQGK